MAIKAQFIFEIMGKPPEHIKDALEKLIDRLGENEGIEIENKRVNEPKEMEDSKGFYTTFADVTINADNLNLIFNIVLNMMPAHVEIIEPSDLKLKNFDLTGILSNLSSKLHRYDEVVKAVSMQKRNLERENKELKEEKGVEEKDVKKKKDNGKKGKKKGKKSKKKRKKKQ